MEGFSHKTTCRICGDDDLVQVLNLGSTPPANSYPKKENFAAEKSFPLVLYFCRTCALAQLLDVVDPEILFRDYHYVTGANPPLVEHFRRYAESAIVPRIQSRDDLVIDIGGNDGLLMSYVNSHARTLVVDPAENLAIEAKKKGVEFHSAFFTSTTADELLQKYGPARVVTANNVFAHTDPIRDVFEGVRNLLTDDGTFIFEVHWVKDLVDRKCFDVIYHEHVCFYSLHAAKRLVELSGMKVFDIEIVPTQGQSLRVYVSKDDRPVERRVADTLAVEKEAGLTDEETFRAFGRSIEANKQTLRTLLLDLKAQGKRIVGYGAPAKSCTLLNYYGIGTDILEYITDATELKQGLYTPGTHIPIVSPDILKKDTPDHIVLFAWNYADSILEREHDVRSRGSKFILIIPEVKIV